MSKEEQESVIRGLIFDALTDCFTPEEMLKLVQSVIQEYNDFITMEEN